jgi:hypothetical protein
MKNVMEKMNAPMKEKDGLQKIGFVANLKGGVYIKELQEKLIETDQEPNSVYLRHRANNAPILEMNCHGYSKESNGSGILADKVRFKGFNTGYQINGEFVYGWFERDSADSGFVGVLWMTKPELKSYARLKMKKTRLFKMGDFYFDSIDDCQSFLDDIAKAAIPESWRYKNKQSAINHPILKSYIETIFIKLKKEKKVIRSADGKYVIFNTNLLDKFFHAIYIIAEAQEAEGIEVYMHPRRTAEESFRDFQKHGFSDDVQPLPPTFFEEINEVIFNPSWKIDKNYDALTHIIEERIERFPAELKVKPSHILAKKLYDAIDYAVAIAQRNYKYIVPIYYPKCNCISFLMPIFLEGTYNTYPDFALVLQTDAENEMYVARTILDLETGYQDARLVAKPDESWLNPVTLKESLR